MEVCKFGKVSEESLVRLGVCDQSEYGGLCHTE